MLLVEAERSSRSMREFQSMVSSCGICIGGEWLRVCVLGEGYTIPLGLA